MLDGRSLLLDRRCWRGNSEILERGEQADDVKVREVLRKGEDGIARMELVSSDREGGFCPAPRKLATIAPFDQDKALVGIGFKDFGRAEIARDGRDFRARRG